MCNLCSTVQIIIYKRDPNRASKAFRGEEEANLRTTLLEGYARCSVKTSAFEAKVVKVKK